MRQEEPTAMAAHALQIYNAISSVSNGFSKCEVVASADDATAERFEDVVYLLSQKLF